MELTKVDAKEIVTEISKLLGTKLNIINREGIIIASSNENRIGSFHEAAYEVIQNDLSGFEIDEANTLEGTLPGQNLPIINDGKVLGVVGITGNTKETRKYISIVQKMTEILVQGKIREAKYQKRQNKINNYFFDCVFNEDYSIREDLISRGLGLGIDITIPRRIIVLSLEESNSSIEKRIINKIKLLDKNNLIFPFTDYFIAAVKDSEDNKIIAQFEKIIDIAKKEKSIIHIGCSQPYQLRSLIRQEYLQALKAFEKSKSREASSFVFYSELDIELVLDNISIDIKREVVEKVFTNFTKKEIEGCLHYLFAFYKADGSLKVASAQLNIHINTLQYHLNKIKAKTGYNPRNYKDSLMFQLAISFYSELRIE